MTTLKLALAVAVAGVLVWTPTSAGQTRPTGRTATVPSAVPAPESVATYRALLDRYCVTCHNARLRTAGLTLDDTAMDLAQVGAAPEVWEQVVHKLRSDLMPPPGRPRPERARYDGFRAWLETALDQAAMAAPDPGRVPTHRLNRAEYVNAIRDLLGLDIDGEALLPADDTGHGFDNLAGTLTVSPALMERYLSAARRISRLAAVSYTHLRAHET